MTLQARTPPILAVRNRAVDFEIRASSFLRHWAFRPSSFAPAWDIDNRLSAKTNDSQALGTADYQYDVLGRRVAKDSGGGSWGKTVTLWWNMREVADYETTGTTPGPKHHYLNLPRHNDRLARTVQVGSSEQVQYYHKNYLDHVYAITDAGGDALEHIRYTAFGLPQHYDFSGLKVVTSPTGNQFLWNGKRLDPQLGWYLYHYRHYSPELGRWPSRDPIEEDGGVNLYGFVGNGPLYAWDWLGLSVDYHHDSGKIVHSDAEGGAGWQGIKPLSNNCEPNEECEEVHLKFFHSAGRADTRRDFAQHLGPVPAIGVLSISQMISEINDRVSRCKCLKTLTIVSHGVVGVGGGFDFLVAGGGVGSREEAQIFGEIIRGRMCPESNLNLFACCSVSGGVATQLAASSGASIIGFTNTAELMGPTRVSGKPFGWHGHTFTRRRTGGSLWNSSGDIRQVNPDGTHLDRHDLLTLAPVTPNFPKPELGDAWNIASEGTWEIVK